MNHHQKIHFFDSYFFVRHDNTSTWLSDEIPTVLPLPSIALTCLKFMSISVANVLARFTQRFSGWCNRTTWLIKSKLYTSYLGGLKSKIFRGQPLRPQRPPRLSSDMRYFRYQKNPKKSFSRSLRRSKVAQWPLIRPPRSPEAGINFFVILLISMV